MAFNYEDAKAKYGAGRARQMAKEAEAGTPAPAAAPAPTTGPRPSGGGGTPTPRPSYPAAPDMSGFQGAGGFEKWSAANRAAGGTGDRSAFDQSMGLWSGGPRPAGPTPSAPAPRQGGAPAPGGRAPLDFNAFMADPSNVGKDPDRLQSEYEEYKFQNDPSFTGSKGGMRDAGGYNAMGDATGMRAYAARNGMSEDFDRFSDAQLAGWEKYKQPNPPDPRKPYLVGGQWVEKPIDSKAFSDQGQGVHGRPGRGGGGGGGGRGGAGAGGGGEAAASGGAGGGGGIEALIQQNLADILKGGGTRYTPEVMQGILAKIKQQTEGSVRRQQEEARSEAAGRGMARAGATGSRMDDIRRGAESGFTGEYADLLQKKVDADFEDKMAGLDRGLQYVEQLKLQLYRQDMTALQREQLRAQISMANKNLAAQREALMSSQQHQKDMLGAEWGYRYAGGAV